MTPQETPQEALQYLASKSLVPVTEIVRANRSYEVLRKLVLDDLARKKNTAETEKIVKP